MRRILLLYLILPVCLAETSAQQWQIFNSGYSYNYMKRGGDSTVYTVFADSMSTSSQDTLLYLNRVVRDHAEGPKEAGLPLQAFYNQPQFLMKELVLTDTLVTFRSPHTFQLIRHPEPGTSWAFDKVNDIQATLVEEKDSTVFGVIDSVQVILLSTGDSVLLSMHFGLLYFGAVYEEHVYQLEGIEEVAGLQLSDYSDIYDFQPGDVFEYESENWGPESDRRGNERWTILERNGDAEGIQYRILKQSSTSSWYWPPYEHRVTGVESVHYTFDKNDPENGYHGQLIPNAQYLRYNDREYNLSMVRVDHSYLGRLTKTAGSFPHRDYFTVIDSANFLLERLIPFAIGTQEMVSYAEGLGQVIFEESYFEGYGLRQLTAYKKDGVVHGNFADDSY